MESISKKIKNIYVQTGFFSKYAPDILVSLLIILFFLILIVYFFLKSSLGDIKEQLKKNRCDSRYIFFSGWVSKKKNQTPLGATMENMTLCLNDLVYSVFLVFVEPLITTTRDMFEKNVMQIKTTSLNAAQTSSLNMLNVNLHVGMKLFRDHLTVLFIPIIKLNQIVNDSLEKFILIMQLVINSLEVHQLNIKHILLSMYKAYLRITIKAGELGVNSVNRGISVLSIGIVIFTIGWTGFIATGSPFFAVLFFLGLAIITVGSIITGLAYILYLTTFGSMSKKADKFKKTLIEIYPDVSLEIPKHKRTTDLGRVDKQANRDAKKMVKKMN